jgi:hypothetical protein
MKTKRFSRNQLQRINAAAHAAGTNSRLTVIYASQYMQAADQQSKKNIIYCINRVATHCNEIIRTLLS